MRCYEPAKLRRRADALNANPYGIRRALLAQTLLVWIVLPVTFLVTDPADNINLVFGLGREPQTSLHPLLYLGLEMALLPIVVCLPAHLLLRRLIGRR